MFSDGTSVSRNGVPLAADAPAIETVRSLTAFHLASARRNENGVVQQRDPECLHGYRVGLRRVRSLLGVCGDVFDPAVAKRVRTELADIMGHTSRLRDLDVYLAGEDGYRALLPEALHAGLEGMFEVLAQERVECREAVRTLLASDDYRRRITELVEAFMNGGLPPGPRAAMPTLEYAHQLIRRRHRKVRDLARSFDRRTSDAEIHALRIQCKKLRYAMEFFAPLFDTESIKTQLKALKKLQDNLGRFNDHAVQRQELEFFLKEHPASGRKGIRLAESLGALSDCLRQLQRKERRRIHGSIERFASMRFRIRAAGARQEETDGPSLR